MAAEQGGVCQQDTITPSPTLIQLQNGLKVHGGGQEGAGNVFNHAAVQPVSFQARSFVGKRSWAGLGSKAIN